MPNTEIKPNTRQDTAYTRTEPLLLSNQHHPKGFKRISCSHVGFSFKMPFTVFELSAKVRPNQLFEYNSQRGFPVQCFYIRGDSYLYKRDLRLKVSFSAIQFHSILLSPSWIFTFIFVGKQDNCVQSESDRKKTNQLATRFALCIMDRFIIASIGKGTILCCTFNRIWCCVQPWDAAYRCINV